MHDSDSGFQTWASETPLDGVLPLRPFLLAVFFNAFIYATSLYAIRESCRAIYRMYRRSKYQCDQCGFSIFGLVRPICPECGNILVRKRS